MTRFNWMQNLIIKRNIFQEKEALGEFLKKKIGIIEAFSRGGIGWGQVFWCKSSWKRQFHKKHWLKLLQQNFSRCFLIYVDNYEKDELWITWNIFSDLADLLGYLHHISKHPKNPPMGFPPPPWVVLKDPCRVIKYVLSLQ